MGSLGRRDKGRGRREKGRGKRDEREGKSLPTGGWAQVFFNGYIN
jgi:hypothetical protein